MIKIIFTFFLFAGIVSAESYNFTELRYSDATGRYVQLEGKIDFSKDGLNIKYPKTLRELDYQNGTLTYLENNKEVPLNDNQTSKMTQYFEVLMLLHRGDESELNDMFEADNNSSKRILKPLGSMKYYINYIELIKEQNRLQYVKLFLKNSDNISINIDDEIR